MNRYIVFAYLNYYPYGGAGDIQGVYETEEEAIEKMSSIDLDRFDNFEIYDIIKKETIHEGSNGLYDKN